MQSPMMGASLVQQHEPRHKGPNVVPERVATRIYSVQGGEGERELCARWIAIHDFSDHQATNAFHKLLLSFRVCRVSAFSWPKP
jgi:hypothetical protein